jgi:predicted nucleic acid-binding protein
VFTEAMYLLQQRSGWAGANALWTLWLRRDLRLAEQSTTALARMHELMSKYADVPMALADASLVALAEDRRETRIFSLESDFHTYVATWGGSRHGFEVIPGSG